METKEIMKKLFLVALALLTGWSSFSQKNMELGMALRTERQWYEQPFVWVAAACLFLYLMVVAIRKSERNN